MASVDAAKIRLVKEWYPIARKEHECDACKWLKHLDDSKFYAGDWNKINEALNQEWKIKKGQEYIRQTNVKDGEIYQYKALPSIHYLTIKHKIYESF